MTVVAFTSDKRLDPTFKSTLEMPRFFQPRAAGKHDAGGNEAEDLRARWWPAAELVEETSGARPQDKLSF